MRRARAEESNVAYQCIEVGSDYVFADGDEIYGYCCIIIGDEPAYHVIDGAWMVHGKQTDHMQSYIEWHFLSIPKQKNYLERCFASDGMAEAIINAYSRSYTTLEYISFSAYDM